MGRVFPFLVVAASLSAGLGLFQNQQPAARAEFAVTAAESSDSGPWYQQTAHSSADNTGNAGCGCQNGCGDCGCGIGGWYDNTEILIGGDSFATIGDFPSGGYGNSFGLVSGFNTGFALGDSIVRGQFGATYGFYDFKGRGFPSTSQSSIEQQVFVTSGIYKRSDMCGCDCDPISWGLVLDAMFTDSWGAGAEEIQLAQARGIWGYALSSVNEVGLWGAVRVQDDEANISGLGLPITVRPMNHLNTYWRHHWGLGGETMLYVGAMDNADRGDWVFGFNGRAPLNHGCSLYGNFNYVTPSASTGRPGDVEDSWNVSVGLVFFWGCKAVSPCVSGDPGLPLLPVANNGSFLVTDGPLPGGGGGT